MPLLLQGVIESQLYFKITLMIGWKYRKVARMVAANLIPPVTLGVSVEATLENGCMSKVERQEKLFKRLDLSGLESWEPEVAKKA